MRNEQSRRMDILPVEPVQRTEIKIGDKFNPFAGIDVEDWLNDESGGRTQLVDNRFSLVGMGNISIELDAVNNLRLVEYRELKMEGEEGVFGEIHPQIKMESTVFLNNPKAEHRQVQCMVEFGGTTIVSSTAFLPEEIGVLAFQEWAKPGEERETFLLVKKEHLRAGGIAMSFQKVSDENEPESL